MSLSDKIKKAREQIVEVGGFKFTIRRPTDLAMVDLRRKPLTPAQFGSALVEFVVGWDGVRHIDLYPGGDPTPAPFEVDAAQEWLADRLDLMSELVDKLNEAYDKHVEDSAAARKN